MAEKKDNNVQRDTLQGPMEFTDLVARIVKDSVLFLLIGVSLFSLMATLGYDAKDPGWSHVGYQPKVANWTGVVGALWSDIAFSFVGLLAWITPLLVLYPCVRLYRRKRVSLLDSLPFVMLRVLGVILFVFSSCALFSLHLSNASLDYPFTSGGIIGQAFSEWLVSWFSIQGSSLVLWLSTMVGLTFFMELSWRDLVLKLGGALLLAYQYISKLFTSNETIADEALAEQLELSSQSEKENHQAVPEKTLSSSLKAALKREPVLSESANMGFSANDRNQQVAEQSSFAKRVVGKMSGVKKEPLVIDDQSKEEAIAPSAVNKQALTDDAINAHLAKPLPALSSLKEPISEKVLPLAEAISPFPPSNNTVQENGVEAVKAAVVEQPSSASDVTKRALKIVPLSETHQSTLAEEAPFANQEKPQSIVPVATVPNVDILDEAEPQTEIGYTQEQLEDMSRLLEVKLKDFGVIVEVVEVNPGPVITRFEIQPAAGVKSSKIVNLAKDLARSLAVMSVRVVEVIPGKSVMGIEIPNINRKMVRLSEVLTAPVYQEAASSLTLALGNDIAGNPVVANLAKMPHLLVAGTTGSGKSVGVNAMILSLLFKAGPEDVRLMLVDPKMLELSIYEGIPHLLTPVITDMKEAAGGLRWCVAEMERRYKLMSKMGVRNLDGFNDKVRAALKAGTPLYDPLWDPEEHGQTPGSPAPALEVLPYIVVVIDEFADMMMIVGKKVEELIARIAQKARAAGIHLILATQRPSVDVITGLIKANVPTRIAFQVSSKIDSRTILDQGGAENLLGNGDMLYLPAGTSVPSRVHGAFVSDDEVHRTVEAWKIQGKPEFIDIQLTEEGTGANANSLFEDDEQDALYDEAVAFITSTRKASISSVQRKFKIGYNRAARIIESMEAAGVISSAGNNGQREVIAPPPPRD